MYDNLNLDGFDSTDSFDNIDGLGTRVKPRAQRPVPMQPSTAPQVPWLASNYKPDLDDRPTVKSMIAQVGQIGVYVLCGAAAVGGVGYVIMTLLSFY